MGYGDVGKRTRPTMTTKKTMRVQGSEVSAVELREFLEGLPDGQPIRIYFSYDQLDTSSMTFEADIR